MSEVWTGGCQCGAIRYEARVRPTAPAYCHCRMCQRVSGAPVMAFADVPVDQFAYVRGEPAIYRSSPIAERRFCPQCGTSLEYRLADAAQVVEVAIASLDRAAELAPQAHMWTESRLPWFETTDTAPRHRREPGVSE
ncbi:MAG TPA: GFA family protein [Magnetospirillum sp.]|nr:GFA family protein [Magnetospirillum sp.]